MKATYFFKRKNNYVGTEKLYMILLLSAIEQTQLKKAGGFDQFLNNTAPLVDKFFLKGAVKFGDGTAIYVFRSLLKDLDSVRRKLEERFKCKCRIKNINNEPTFAELLIKQHGVSDANVIRIYIDTERKPRYQKRGKLHATFRAPRNGTLELFETVRKLYGSRLIKEFQAEKVIAIRGYKPDIDLLRRHLHCGAYLRISESYENLLAYAYA